MVIVLVVIVLAGIAVVDLRANKKVKGNTSPKRERGSFRKPSLALRASEKVEKQESEKGEGNYI